MMLVPLLLLSVCCRCTQHHQYDLDTKTICLAWDDFWPDESIVANKKGKQEEKYTPTNANNVYVKNAIFEELKEGAIQFSSNDNSKMLIELSNFLAITNTIDRVAVVMTGGGERVSSTKFVL